MDDLVHVYGRPGCGPCIAVKAHLHKRDVAFVEHDVTADPDAEARIRALGYLQTPVVVAGDLHRGGFHPAWLDRLARARGHDVDDQTAIDYLEETQ